MATYIRKRKDGNGYSECSSPDELVGRGRCCHILEGGNNSRMELSRIQRGMYEVKINEDSLSINGQKDTIAKFFDSLPQIDEEKKNKIIKYLNEEDEFYDEDDID